MKGYAVEFKLDCPHIDQSQIDSKTIGDLNNLKTNFQTSSKCNKLNCTELDENWICVSCLQFNCSRYINEHAVDHFQETQHPVALSMFDLSFWCYECNRYIKNPRLTIMRDIIKQAKFGN
jgi:uncharacterized UBP type Zn finger protein